MLNFYRGLRKDYPSNITYTHDLWDAIYFATDTFEIIVNGEVFGVDTNKKVTDIQPGDHGIVVEYTDGSTYDVFTGIDDDTQQAIETLKTLINPETGKLDFSLNYTTALDDSIHAKAVGGITESITVGDLKGKKTLSEVLDMIIFPEIFPVYPANQNNVKATLSLNNYSATQEVGSTAPTAANLKTGFERDVVKLNGKPINGSDANSPYAGAMTEGILYYGSSTANTTLPTKVTYGTTNYYYKVTYDEGPTYKSTYGNNSGTPCPAGTKTSSAVAVTGVYCVYATTGTNGAMIKLAANSSVSNVQLAMPSENPHKHCFKIYGTLTKIEFENPTKANDWVNVPLSTFTKTTEDIEVNGETVEYNVYTRSDAGFAGDYKYRITYTKK